MENDCVLVWTTIGKTADGRDMASILVTERLAACVNVLPEMESFYRWKGQVETDHERQLDHEDHRGARGRAAERACTSCTTTKCPSSS